MKSVISITNWTLIAAAAYGIWYLSAYFYLGTEEMHRELITELPKRFLDRTMMPLLLATLFSVLLGLANWLVYYFTRITDKRYVFKTALMALIVSLLSGLLGGISFFWGGF